MADNNLANLSLRKPARKTSEVWFLLLILFLIASCAPKSAVSSQAAPVSLTDPTPRPNLSAPPLAVHVDQVRFGLVGAQNKANVWSLFDESGASFSGYAVRANYWPRLFVLDPNTGELKPQAAKSLPSAIKQEGDYYVGEVKLRDDLKWTDNTAFTADDVVFTVQNALAFELTYDWQVHYDPQFLHHAEAVDVHTVKFYFKQKPNVSAWEYGVLQGPLVQKAYWEPKMQAAVALLPSDDARAQMADVNNKIATTQAEIDRLYASLPLYKLNSADYRAVQLDITRNQKDLDSIKNQLSTEQDDYSAKIKSAHDALFALENNNEPLLGVWLPDGAGKNKANASFPSKYDQASFHFYPSEKEAITAIQNGDEDVLLAPDGVDQKDAETLANEASITITRSPSDRVRFLMFNHSRAELSNPALRRALNCLIDRSTFSHNEIPLATFVPAQNIFWHNTDARDECSGKAEKDRRQKALEILDEAGYTWNTEPTPNKNGLGLLMPEGGQPFPKMTLLSPSADVDPMRAEVAEYIVKQARSFGIPLEVRYASMEDVTYSVYSSKDYDLVILGWKIGTLPSYLCDWVGAGNPFSYAAPASGSACEAFDSASELTEARDASFKLQSALMVEFPLIPLFVVPRFDVYRKGFPLEVLNAPIK